MGILIFLLFIAGIVGALILNKHYKKGGIPPQPAPEFLEQRYHHFFEVAPIGIALIDTDYKIIECNHTFSTLVHRDRTTLVAQEIQSLFEGEDQSHITRYLSDILLGKKTLLPLEVKLSFDQQSAIQLFAKKLEEKEGLILHFIDVSEQKKLELQFAQSQKMQAVGQLAGGVAHDFNNLLTAMIGFCDLLLLRHKAGDHSFHDLMQIKQNANRAANLVRQLLAFSRQQTLQPRTMDITDILAELSHLIRRLIGENIVLHMSHGRELGLVKVDQGQLEQVIINLAVNARDAMSAGGTLSITTSNVSLLMPVRKGAEEMPAGEYVVVEVKDTGTGISKEHIDRIFEPFFSTKEIGYGTGLGLSTVYGIVRQTGGFVFVESKLKQGTKFTIYLPRCFEKESLPILIEPLALPNIQDLTGAGTILLVEDEDAVRTFSTRALRNKGYHVLDASSGEEALEIIGRPDQPIDLIITDVVMPNMDGPTLIKQVHALKPDMKVIFISGYTEERFSDQLEKGHKFEFLPKPFNLKQLAEKVKEVID